MIGGESPFRPFGPRTPTAVREGRSTTFQTVLSIGACLTAIYFLMPVHAAKDVVYLLVAIGAVLCIVTSTVRYRPVDPVGWYLLAAAATLFVLGDAVSYFDELIRHVDPGFPSLPDWLFLGGYPFLFLGVYRIGRRPGIAGARERWADAAMISLGAFALTSRFLIDPYLQDPIDHHAGEDRPDGLSDDGSRGAVRTVGRGGVRCLLAGGGQVADRRGQHAGGRRLPVRGAEPGRRICRRRPLRCAVPAELRPLRSCSRPSEHGATAPGAQGRPGAGSAMGAAGQRRRTGSTRGPADHCGRWQVPRRPVSRRAHDRTVPAGHAQDVVALRPTGHQDGRTGTERRIPQDGPVEGEAPGIGDDVPVAARQPDGSAQPGSAARPDRSFAGGPPLPHHGRPVRVRPGRLHRDQRCVRSRRRRSTARPGRAPAHHHGAGQRNGRPPRW